MLYVYIYINMTYRLSMGLSVCPILTAPAKPAALQGAATGALRRCWVHPVPKSGLGVCGIHQTSISRVEPLVMMEIGPLYHGNK